MSSGDYLMCPVTEDEDLAAFGYEDVAVETASCEQSRATPRPAGVAGCVLSHLRVYQAMLADGLDSAVVLEDDVILPADLGSLIDAIADHLTGAEVALLNYNGCRMSLEGSVSLPLARLLALPLDVRQSASTAAYLITGKACERMNETDAAGAISGARLPSTTIGG